MSRLRLRMTRCLCGLGLAAGLAAAAAGCMPISAPDVAPAQATSRQGIVIADRLNVRGGPGTEHPVLSKLVSGDTVEVLRSDESGAWHAVDVAGEGEPGWVAAAYVVLLGEAGPAAPAAVTATGAPTLTGRTEVSATAAVSVPTVLEAPLAAALPTPTVPTAVTRPPSMNVRSGPGTIYTVVSALNAGTQLEILALSSDRSWYQVRLDGQEEPAWIAADLVDVSGPLESVQPISEEEVPPPPEAAAPAPPPVVSAAASAPPPSGAGFFGYGLQAHMLGGGISEAVNATADLGFNWLKQQVEWRTFEGSPGALDFSELRRIADTAGSRGISLLFSVVNAPEWAREPGFDPTVGGPPADPQSYANFVGRLAGDFCGSALRAIEVWNEQNLHYEWGNKPLDPAEYMRLLAAAYASIKAACPSMLVISGALTPAGDAGPYARDDFAYLEGMYQNGLARYADGIGAHPSGYNVPPSVPWQEACAVIGQTGNFFNGACDTPHHSWSFRSTLEGYRNIMVAYGDGSKRLWPTEFGWAVGPAVNGAYAYANDNTAEEQAAWTVEAYQMMRTWGWVGPAFLWNLNFRVIADGSEKAQWGIVRNDYSPLPVYTALKNMPK